MGIKSLLLAAVCLLFIGCGELTEQEPTEQGVTTELKESAPPPSTLTGCSAHSDCLFPYNGIRVDCSAASGACQGFSDRAVCGTQTVYCTRPPNPPSGCNTCDPDFECCNFVNGCIVPARNMCI